MNLTHFTTPALQIKAKELIEWLKDKNLIQLTTQISPEGGKTVARYIFTPLEDNGDMTRSSSANEIYYLAEE